MNWKLRSTISILLIAVISSLFGAVESNAIVAFSKKYDASCALCHQEWPTLNRFGEQFKLNGYQMLKSPDGSTTAKRDLKTGLFLDIGNANPPISLSVKGGLHLTRKSSGPDGTQNSGLFSEVDGTYVDLVAAGTFAEDVAYYILAPLNSDQQAIGHAKFSNMFGSGSFAIDLGAMRLFDYDVPIYSRPIFGTWAKYDYTPFYNRLGYIGINSHSSDTGIRLYGNPGYDKFVYELALFTGSNITEQGDNDSANAYTMMWRLNLEALALSLRFYSNDSSIYDMNYNYSGESIAFTPNLLETDESLKQFILNLQYPLERLLLDFSFESVSLDFDARETTTDSGTYNLSATKISKESFGAGLIWKTNSWFLVGFGVSYSTVGEYDYIINGTNQKADKQKFVMYALRTEFDPAVNMKIGLEYMIDKSNEEARTRSDQTIFDKQNQFMLQWRMTF